MGWEEEEAQPVVLPLTQRQTPSMREEGWREAWVQSQTLLLPVGTIQLERPSAPRLVLSGKKDSLSQPGHSWY